MPRISQIQDAMLRGDCFHALHGKGKLAASKNEFQLCGQVAVISRHFAALPHFFGEGAKDFLDFLLLRRHELCQVIVQSHGNHRLHEKGLPRGGTVVDDAVEFVAILLFHRHHVAAISLGHDGFAEIGRLVLVRHQLLEGFADAVLNHFLFRADAGQLRRRAVAHFAVFVENPMDMVDELFLGNDERRDFLQRRIHQVPLPFEVVVHFFIGFQRRGEIDKFLGEKDHLLPRFAQDFPDVVGLA